MFTLLLVFSTFFMFDSHSTSQTNSTNPPAQIDEVTGTPIPKIAIGDTAILSAIQDVHESFSRTDSLSNILDSQIAEKDDSVFRVLVKEMEREDRRKARHRRKNR